MHRLITVLVVLVVIVAACSNDGDGAPQDLSGICPPVERLGPDVNPFDVLTTGSAEEVEESLATVSELYGSLLDAVPDDLGYPQAVLAATSTIPPTTPVTTTPTDSGDGEEDDEEPVDPTPHRDLQLISDVLDDVREVLADHDHDVVAAEEDLRQVPAFAEPSQLAEVVSATGRLRALIDRECQSPPPPATTPTTGG